MAPLPVDVEMLLLMISIFVGGGIFLIDISFFSCLSKTLDFFFSLLLALLETSAMAHLPWKTINLAPVFSCLIGLRLGDTLVLETWAKHAPTKPLDFHGFSLHPWRLTWNMSSWRFGRTVAFLNGWFLGSMLIFQGVQFHRISSFSSLLNPPRFFKSLEPFCHETLESPEAWPCTPGTVGNPHPFCWIRQTPRWKMATCSSNYTCGSMSWVHDGGD